MDEYLLKMAVKNAVKEAFNENYNNYNIDIIPRSDGTFIAYDPIARQRIYKKGTIQPMSWKSESEAKEGAMKFLKNKYSGKIFT